MLLALLAVSEHPAAAVSHCILLGIRCCAEQVLLKHSKDVKLDDIEVSKDFIAVFHRSNGLQVTLRTHSPCAMHSEPQCFKTPGQYSTRQPYLSLTQGFFGCTLNSFSQAHTL